MIKKILVPTDFSQTSLRGLEYAVDLGRRLRARLIVICVVEPIQYMPPSDFYGGMSMSVDLLSEQQGLAKAQLSDLAKQLKKRGLQFETLLSTGTPYRRIVEAAKTKRVDLVVMATHGRGGVSHLLLGSVAEKVVRLAPCPVLTLRDYGRRRRKSTAAPQKRRTRSAKQ